MVNRRLESWRPQSTLGGGTCSNWMTWLKKLLLLLPFCWAWARWNSFCCLCTGDRRTKSPVGRSSWRPGRTAVCPSSSAGWQTPARRPSSSPVHWPVQEEEEECCITSHFLLRCLQRRMKERIKQETWSARLMCRPCASWQEKKEKTFWGHHVTRCCSGTWLMAVI